MGWAPDTLAGRRALVTGASRGIGRAVAVTLAGLGADVAVAYKTRRADAEAVVAEIRHLGRRAVAIAADLESERAVAALFDAVAAAFDGLDIFVANAAATAFKPAGSWQAHHLDRTHALNLRSFVLAAQHAARLMPPGGGHIVAVSSYGSQRCLPGYGALGAMKAALEAWVRYLACEWAPRGIHVNAVNPGVLDTDSSRLYFARSGAGGWDQLIRLTPMRRLARPEDVANVVAFLCTPEADFICGQTITVDGGLTWIAPPFRDEPPPA